MKNQRRKFLKNTLAIATTASVAPYLVGCSQRKKAKVIIIGAGLAGLNVAHLLQQQGLEPIVLEASDQVGGRTLSLMHGDEAINMGGIEIGDAYTRFVSLCKEFNLNLIAPESSPRDLAIFKNNKLFSSDDWKESEFNNLPESLHNLVPSRLQFSLHFKDFPLKSTTDWYKNEFSQYDIPESQRLRALGADDAAIDLINRAGNFNDINSVSSLHVMRALANFRYGTSKKTLRLDGGNNQLCIEMAGAQNNVHLKHAVHAITQTSKGIEIDCQNGSQWLAEHVVLAIPFSVLRGIKLSANLPAAQQRAITNLPYTKISKLMAQVNDPFWENDGLPANMWCDSPLERCFLTTTAKGNSYYTIFINGSGTNDVDKLTADAAQEWILQELKKVRPSAYSAIEPIAYHSWGNDPYAQGAYAAFAPGQITDFAQAMLKPAGNIYFAGEHCARAASGLEGALESGEFTAAQVLNALVT